MINTTCPMDRLNLGNVHVYNPIEAEIKVVEIKHATCKYICRDKQNRFKVLTGKTVRNLSGCMENYNHVISLSNSLEEIYEIFTEGSFQMLLDMRPNASERGFDVFLQSIGPVKSEFDLKLQNYENLRNTIWDNKKMIDKEIWKIKCDIKKYGDNDELVMYLKDLELFNKISDLLYSIYDTIYLIKRLFCNISFKDQCKLRCHYEKVKINIPHYRDSILLNLNHAKSLILQLPKPSENIEYLDLFANTPESCLLCRNNKNEDLICRFDKCHHKICKNCEEMFDLQNIICPIENEMIGSRLISNPVDVEEILINACQKIQMKWLESSFKMIEFTKENHFKLLTADRSGLCQLNVPTFKSILYNEYLIHEMILQTHKIYSSYYSSNADKFSEEIKEKVDKHFGFVKKCRKYCNEIWKGLRIIKIIEDHVINNLFNHQRTIKIQPDIKEIFDKWNRLFKNIITTFDGIDLEDDYGLVGKALQSLRQLFASGFD